MNSDWKITLVPAGNWVRGNHPQKMTREARVHLVPQSLRAAQFCNADMQPENTWHLTYTGLNPSWVKVGNTWVRAYRVNIRNTAEAREMAKRYAEMLEAQLEEMEERGFPQYSYIGLPY